MSYSAACISWRNPPHCWLVRVSGCICPRPTLPASCLKSVSYTHLGGRAGAGSLRGAGLQGKRPPADAAAGRKYLIAEARSASVSPFLPVPPFHLFGGHILSPVFRESDSEPVNIQYAAIKGSAMQKTIPLIHAFRAFSFQISDIGVAQLLKMEMCIRDSDGAGFYRAALRSATVS